ncbi:MAG: ABC transporter permease [Anaerolineae bacterium]
MTVKYVATRVAIFFLVIWTTATINFVMPRLAPGDPVQAMLGRMAEQGQVVEGGGELVKEYRELFGLDDRIIVQYGKYLWNLVNFNMGYSLAHFPARVIEIILDGLPYTLGLLSISAFLQFSLGIVLGALFVWPRAPKVVDIIAPFFFAISPIPYYLFAMFLIYFFAYTLHVLPHSGAFTIGRVYSGFSLAQAWDLVRHSILPAFSIILSGMGGWALGMRGMMITVLGEDFLTLARAKGLRDSWIFLRYAMRNAMLPQFTGLAISMGFIVSGSSIVELMFTYPGVGYKLYQSIVNADYTVMQGITFFIVVSVATAVLIIDLLYPVLDPRITYERR